MGYQYSTAVDVVPLPDDVTGLDTEVQSQPQGFAGGTAAEGTINSLSRRGENGQHPVAEHLALDRRASGLPDD